MTTKNTDNKNWKKRLTVELTERSPSRRRRSALDCGDDDDDNDDNFLERGNRWSLSLDYMSVIFYLWIYRSVYLLSVDVH
jgi:hypothetical protein